MPAGLLSPETKHPINGVSPVDWLHPLNRDRLVWYYQPTGYKGGSRIMDLCQRENPASYGVLSSGTWATWVGTPYGAGINGENGDLNYAAATPSAATRSAMHGAMAAWYRPESADPSPIFIGVGDNSTNLRQTGLGADDSGSNKFRVFHAANGSTTIQATTTSATYTSGRWYRVLWVMTPAGGRFFVNGSEQALTYSTGSSSTVSWIGNHTTVSVVRYGTGGGLSIVPAGCIDGILADGSIWGARSLAVTDPVSFARMDYELSSRGYPGVLNRVRWPIVSVAAAPTGNRRRRLLLCGGGA